MHYKLSYTSPHKHLVDIELTIEHNNASSIVLQLPAWRPGRYELQNYAKNILRFAAKDANGNILSYKKTSRNCWQIDTNGHRKAIVTYTFFAKQMDAGGSWLDENQLYVNFINCLMYIPGRENEPCTIEIKLPEDYKTACGLEAQLVDVPGAVHLLAKDFYQLADSPLMASKTLQSHTFPVLNSRFSIHIIGNCQPDWTTLEKDFTSFIKPQIELFGGFPEKDYHFLFQILPYRHYHGVEHRNSTVITLGPDMDFGQPEFYKQLLGISSHELFHAWNICKIRPAEMMPYDLTKENYFPTGFVAEGVTTYYGDLMLSRAGLWDTGAYFAELNDNLQRHIENPGRNFSSLAQSSIDLWADGYQKSHPFRKVSIYDKGALVALILDLEIRRATQNKKSLDDVMRTMWLEFGKTGKGYSLENYREIVEKTAGFSLQKYFDDCIYGVAPLEKLLAHSLNFVGCTLQFTHSPDDWENYFGMRLSKGKESRTVVAIAPGSPADKVLDTDDEILEVNGHQLSEHTTRLPEDRQMVELTVRRNNTIARKSLLKDGGNHFLRYAIGKQTSGTTEQEENFRLWLKNKL